MDIENSGLHSYLLTIMVVNTGIAWGKPLRSPEPLLGLGRPTHLQNKQTTYCKRYRRGCGYDVKLQGSKAVLIRIAVLDLPTRNQNLIMKLSIFQWSS